LQRSTVSCAEESIMAHRLLTLPLLLIACAAAYCIPAFARAQGYTSPRATLGSVSPGPATAARRPIAHQTAHFTACPDDPGGAFYNVHVKLVSCGRGESILHHDGHGYGFRCHVVGYGPGGGFPAYKFCGRHRAAVSGGVLDGQATS
jgi:hypothetical protein